MSFLFSRKADPENKDPQEPVPSVTEPYDVKIGVSDEHRKHIAAILQVCWGNILNIEQIPKFCSNWLEPRTSKQRQIVHLRQHMDAEAADDQYVFQSQGS